MVEDGGGKIVPSARDSGSESRSSTDPSRVRYPRRGDQVMVREVKGRGGSNTEVSEVLSRVHNLKL